MLSQNLLSQPKTTQSKVLNTNSFSNVVSYMAQDEFPIHSNKQENDIASAKEEICQFFLKLVKVAAPELVLTEFENLFVNPSFLSNSEIDKALKLIVLSHNEPEFRNTLKRCIYILLNSWIYSREYEFAQSLIEKLSIPHTSYSGSSTFLRKLRHSMINFMKSQDYQEIKLFALKQDHQEPENWKYRYTSYLLTPQYLNSDNCLEQRQAARRLSQQLQDKYKFDLAMYTTHSHSTSPRNDKIKNPTALGDEALRLIKTILAKKGFFNYVNLANIFLNQTQQVSYYEFKESLVNYLIFSLENTGLVESIKMHLTQKLDSLYQDQDHEKLRNGLTLRTCNRVIEYLTLDKDNKPSDMFVLIASQGNALTLSILILKLLLICPPSRTFLELCMSKLINYYGNHSKQDCQWVINFVEVSKIILTMYTENVKYNLVNMERENLPGQNRIDDNGYRIFCKSYAHGK